ncbi:MAG: RNA polymerase sigma factor [Candidatus Vogelbacteria bacterium]|nr:RNA polymerase sigma factor [Candidatus Vogelbacteria bacterium]
MLLDDFVETKENLESKKDEEILALSINSPSLFGILVDRYEEAFLRKARKIIKRQEEAEDIVQEAFTRIYMNAARFRVQEGATFKSWGYKILINLTLTHYQKLKKEIFATVEMDPDLYEILPDLQTKDHEKESLRDYVTSILSRMPGNLSKVLKLYFIDGVPQKEIAEMEGVSVGAIKTRICRAKKDFKKVKATV